MSDDSPSDQPQSPQRMFQHEKLSGLKDPSLSDCLGLLRITMLSSLGVVETGLQLLSEMLEEMGDEVKTADSPIRDAEKILKLVQQSTSRSREVVDMLGDLRHDVESVPDLDQIWKQSRSQTP